MFEPILGQKIYVACPPVHISGGPEACHQLIDALNLTSQRAWGIDPTARLDQLPEVPAPYRMYNVPTSRLRDIESNSIVVLPEIYAKHAGHFPDSRVYFWWLSVDGFLQHAKWTPIGRILGPDRAVKYQLRKLRDHVRLHLYQSEYTRSFVEAHRLGRGVRLTDYLAEDFTSAIDKPDAVPRENLIAYNPLKGLQRTESILAALRASGSPMPECVPVVGMSRPEVRGLLSRAKLYIDFGNHPGRDRLPREAVACGACILVNQRGTAANPTDLAIDPEFKIDDRQSGYEEQAVTKILEVMADFERNRSRLSGFRRSLATQAAEFVAETQAAFPLGP